MSQRSSFNWALSAQSPVTIPKSYGRSCRSMRASVRFMADMARGT
jgi:hypothetical protein